VIVGATGSGKTNLMIRLWAGWFTAALDAHHAGEGDRPLLIVLDCKGGTDARKKAERTRRLIYGAGARNVAIWPDQARVSLWDLPAPDLAVLLYQMIESGTGSAAYYADILYAATVLAVTAPPGPPLNAAAFLDRLDEHWLTAAWDTGTHPQHAARVGSGEGGG
jgi:GTPase SAR1 family protein